ncbi:Diphthamide biosynthesis protein 1 [Trichinella zimbabwensis]|uniref:2-(3-amino-3-carboxypropyl)histidine synthase subunit 1 n=1 Tax=Trichinella zimbabwensis TaxID=268475 RepID=A0A0V1HNC7_9BILA|nr:Diphthamide biosynthesis protein 1 [Trichinella zimbabwensis]
MDASIFHNIQHLSEVYKMIIYLHAHSLALRLAACHTIDLAVICAGHVWKKTIVNKLDKNRFMTMWFVVCMVCMVGFCVVNIIHSLQMLIHRHDFDIHLPFTLLITVLVEFIVKSVGMIFLDFGLTYSRSTIPIRTLFILSPAFSVLIIAALRYLGYSYLVLWLDPVLTICTCFILSVLSILSGNAADYMSVLLMAVPKEVKLENFESKFKLRFPGEKFHQLHVWADTKNHFNLSVHMRFKKSENYLQNFQSIKSFFSEHGITMAVLQPEFEILEMNVFSKRNLKLKKQQNMRRSIVRGIPVEILEDERLNAAVSMVRKVLQNKSNILPSNYDFEIHKTIWKIRREKIRRVYLQFPEGLLLFSCLIADILEEFGPCETVISCDVVYGACCVDDYAAKAFDCELLVHYGHSCLIPVQDTAGCSVLYVFVSIKFDTGHFIDTLRHNFNPESRLALVSTVQFISSLQAARKALSNDFKIELPQVSPLSPGEILGCTAPRFNEDMDAIIFVGDGRFHLESVMIANPDVPAFKYDPYGKKCFREHYDHKTMRKQRHQSVEKASNCKKFGLIFGALGRQGNIRIMETLRDQLLASSREVFEFVMSEISLEKFWVQIACPRLSIDWGLQFIKPVITPYELMVAMDGIKWQKQYPMDYYAFESLGPWTNNFGKRTKQHVKMRYTNCKHSMIVIEVLHEITNMLQLRKNMNMNKRNHNKIKAFLK